MMKLLFLSMLLLLTCVLTSMANDEEQTGFICIAPIPKPNSEPISLSNPAGGGRDFNFSLQIDNHEILELPFNKDMKYGGLSLKKKHIIKIRNNHEIVESFWFRFDEYHSNKLCLWFKALYGTWSLWELDKDRRICGCNTGG